MHTDTGPSSSWTHPIPRWEPPLGAEALAHVLDRVQGLALLEDVLDAAGDALDDQGPPVSELPRLDDSLRAGLSRLTSVGLSDFHNNETTEELVGRARRLCRRALPADEPTAVLHVRRLALVTEALMEHLIAIQAMSDIEPPPSVPQELSQNWYFHA